MKGSETLDCDNWLQLLESGVWPLPQNYSFLLKDFNIFPRFIDYIIEYNIV